MTLKNIRIIDKERLSEKETKGIKSDFVVLEVRNPNLREEYKELPNNSISEYLHSLGEIKEDDNDNSNT